MADIDRCTGGTASADSFNDISQIADKAFDADNATFWASTLTNYPHWIKYDFGAGITWAINKVTIKASTDYDEYAPNAFTIQGSNNDTNWDTLYTASGLSNWTPQETRTFAFGNSVAYRYIRTYATDCEAGTVNKYCIINKIEMIVEPKGGASFLLNFL